MHAGGDDRSPLAELSGLISLSVRKVRKEFMLYTSEQGMGRWVMGQMGHENLMGHMGRGSLGVDP